MGFFRRLLKKAKDQFDLEGQPPPARTERKVDFGPFQFDFETPPPPVRTERKVRYPTDPQMRAIIEAQMEDARQQALQMGMPQRFADRIFSESQYTPPPKSAVMMQEGGPASYGADFRGTGRKREDELRRSQSANSEQKTPVDSDQNKRFIPSIFGPAQSVPTTAAQGVGSLLDPENYKRFNPRASDPFRGMRTKIVSGPFGDMEVPVTFEGNTYGGSGSTFDAQGNVSGTMPIQTETFVPVEDPYGRAKGDRLPSIFGATGTTGTNLPLGAMQSSPPVQTAPLPASEIYPNVITPVERDPVFPSYDDPITVNNPFEKPAREPIDYGIGYENAPPGFESTDGPVTMALESFINPSTGDTWTAPNGGVIKMPPGWMRLQDYDPEKEYPAPAPSVPPVNTIQAPPTSPFQNDMVSILPMPTPGAFSPPVYEPNLRDRTRVPFQQGIGSFVR